MPALGLSLRNYAKTEEDKKNENKNRTKTLSGKKSEASVVDFIETESA